jgi:translation initiation factor RLI1
MCYPQDSLYQLICGTQSLYLIFKKQTTNRNKTNKNTQGFVHVVENLRKREDLHFRNKNTKFKNLALLS